jgi:hypothetical protein
MVCVPEKLGCGMNCGTPNKDQIVVSDFILNCKPGLFDTVFSLRKDVIDYCFCELEGYKGSEQLVGYDEANVLVREDFLDTMFHGQQIESNVLNCWTILLNYLESSGGAAVKKTPRCYFGLNMHVRVLCFSWFYFFF